MIQQPSIILPVTTITSNIIVGANKAEIADDKIYRLYGDNDQSCLNYNKQLYNITIFILRKFHRRLIV